MTPNRTSGVFTWWISTKVPSNFRLLWASLTESEVNSTTSKPGKAAQSLCGMSGSTFHLNHREWNSLFRLTAERHGKLIGYVSSHDRYRHPIFKIALALQPTIEHAKTWLQHSAMWATSRGIFPCTTIPIRCVASSPPECPHSNT